MRAAQTLEVQRVGAVNVRDSRLLVISAGKPTPYRLSLLPVGRFCVAIASVQTVLRSREPRSGVRLQREQAGHHLRNLGAFQSCAFCNECAS